MRFSKEPPYSSSRWFDNGDRKLVQQVAVGGVHLDGVEPGGVGPAGGVGKARRQLADLLDRQRAGRGVPREGDGRRRHGLPAAVLDGHAALAGGGSAGVGERGEGRRLASRVRELDPDRHALLVHRRDHPCPRLLLDVVPESGVLRADAAFGHHRGGLGEEQPEAARRPRDEVRQVPVGRHAVAREARVLAHRRQPDTVAGGDAAEGDGFEKSTHVSGATSSTVRIFPARSPRPPGTAGRLRVR
ncbi:hypothetical protein QE370_001576 [Aeromicrobium sp. SORGH_AS981]|nr:hypothetical protein [Aeromicrobium sp. SORGH_AS_0981]